VEDREATTRINQLDAEEHERLAQGERGMGMDEARHERRRRIHVDVDRLWDLVRQHRARRHAGLDRDGARLRSADTVAHHVR
jgi:hypothetical protein